MSARVFLFVKRKNMQYVQFYIAGFCVACTQVISCTEATWYWCLVNNILIWPLMYLYKLQTRGVSGSNASHEPNVTPIIFVWNRTWKALQIANIYNSSIQLPIY